MNKKTKHSAFIIASLTLKSYSPIMLIYGAIISFGLIAFLAAQLQGWIGLSDAYVQDIWDSALSTATIFFLVIGIMITPGLLSSYVVNGMTRKHFAAGMMLCALLFAAAYSILVGAVQFIGRKMVFGAGDSWTTELPAGFAGFLLNFALYFLFIAAGWLIGTLYYRFNWKWATLMSVAAFIVASTGQLILEEKPSPEGFLAGVKNWMVASMGTQFMTLLFMYALLLGVNYFVLRRIPIRQKIVA